MRRGTRGGPWGHWVLLTFVLLGVLVLLSVAGYTGGQLGEGSHVPQANSGSAGVPPAILGGGPIIDPSHPGVAGVRPPGRTAVLTFDDGPSDWTPQILDVLERHHVPAAFFVVGSHAATEPGLLQRMRADGDEVGVHTFTHANLGSVPAWVEQLELDETQRVIAAATGNTTDLLRPPFASEPADISDTDWQAITRARNYRVVLASLDTEDWRTPGVDKIVAAGTPTDGAGAVIMLHDGGGDRSETVAAVEQLITTLQAQGYEFRTVTQAAGAPSAWHPASTVQRLRGDVVIWVVRAARALVAVLRVAFIALAVLSVLRTVLLLLLARRHHRSTPAPAAPDPLPGGEPGAFPPVTVVVPGYNEELGIAAAVRSLAASDYPTLEIIVVDDGSTDATANIVEAMNLVNVTVIRQDNAGKPAALNTGIAAGSHDILVLVDGDTVFEPDAMRALVAPFADPGVGAVSGNTKVGNRGGLLGRWQHTEYVIGFNLDRRMFDVLQCMPTVPGAIGAFRRDVLDAVGGVSDDTLAEDTDLTMATCRAGWRVVYAPTAIAWTEAPASLSQLWRQRYRWCYGTLQAMWKHRHATIEGGASGKLGRRGLPYLLAFQVLLPLLAPVIDVAAAYTIIFQPSKTIALAWLAFLALQYISAAYAFILDRESLKPLWSLILQQLLYRQLMYMVVLHSTASALYGIRLRWHKLTRTGQLDSAPTPTPTPTR